MLVRAEGRPPSGSLACMVLLSLSLSRTQERTRTRGIREASLRIWRCLSGNREGRGCQRPWVLSILRAWSPALGSVAVTPTAAGPVLPPALCTHPAGPSQPPAPGDVCAYPRLTSWRKRLSRSLTGCSKFARRGASTVRPSGSVSAPVSTLHGPGCG